MAKGFKAQHFEDYSIVKGNVKVKLNLKQYGEKLQKAHGLLLVSPIMTFPPYKNLPIGGAPAHTFPVPCNAALLAAVCC